MKNIYKTIAVCSLVVTLFSCEKRSDKYADENTAPSGTISSKLNIWSDSDDYTNVIIDSLKNQNEYKIAYRYFDNAGQTQLKISKPEFGKVLYQGIEITYDSYFDVSNNYDKYSYVSDSLGNEQIDFTVKDPYDLEQNSTLFLYVFKNLLPTTSFEMVGLNNLESLEYKIDASKSFDADDKFGGGLVLFQYVIDNDTTYHPYNTMNYIFPEIRDYVISVKAMDSDSIWSPYQTIGVFTP